MSHTDLNDSVPVTRDIHWVGFREPGGRIRCNPYLILDHDQAVLIDPGSIPDFPTVMRKVIDLVNPTSISHIVVSHQDPDVCGSLAVVEDLIQRPDLRIVAHINTWRLIQHQGLTSDVIAIGDAGGEITLDSGRVLSFYHLPYLHSPGAMATYDAARRALFSGDLFGAIQDDDELFAGAGFPQNMAAFHQLYMPAGSLVRRALSHLRTLPINLILPQHGCVIEGDQVTQAMDFLAQLPCGVDLLDGADQTER